MVAVNMGDAEGKRQAPGIVHTLPGHERVSLQVDPKIPPRVPRNQARVRAAVRRRLPSAEALAVAFFRLVIRAAEQRAAEQRIHRLAFREQTLRRRDVGVLVESLLFVAVPQRGRARLLRDVHHLVTRRHSEREIRLGVVEGAGRQTEPHGEASQRREE